MFNLTLPTILRGPCYHCFHFASEDTESQRGPGSHSEHKAELGNFSPGSPTLELTLSHRSILTKTWYPCSCVTNEKTE